MRLTENSQCKKILDALMAAKGQWVSMVALVEVSGSYNVHSRVDELRHKHGFIIDNETDLTTRPHKSFYRVPAL
jgi:hypothetical protein